MNSEGSVFCAICLVRHAGAAGWFLLTENRWIDRLKILSWNNGLASQAGMYAACGVAHVQQLVAHWMATGSLEYPFAYSEASGGISIPQCSSGPIRAEPDLDNSGSTVLGELAVHRESLDRILLESPESLAGILSALRDALVDEESSSRVEAGKRAEDGMYALTEI